MTSGEFAVDPDDRKRLYQEAFAEGRIAGGEGCHVLADEMDEIERLVRRGHKITALKIAAEAMIMEPQELAGLLPSMTEPGLLGYLRGLVAGEAERQALQQYNRTKWTQGPKRRVLYGRN